MAIANPIVQAQFTKFIESESLSGSDEATLFEIFSIFTVEQGLLSRNLNFLDIHLKGSEFGIDGVAIIVNDELITDKSQIIDLKTIQSAEFHFFQTKSGKTLKTGDVANFYSAIEDFFSEDFDSNSDDLNALHAIKEYIYSNSGELTSNPSLKAFFIFTGKLEKPKEITKLITKTTKRLEQTRMFGEVTLQIIDAGKLQDAYRNAVRFIERTIVFKDSVVLPTATNTAASYLGFIEATEIIKLVQSDADNNINKSVFVDNIRDYNPNTDVNKKIANSLSSGEGEMFVFRNNGITAVARSIRPTGKSFRISDYQIVNGCQTCHILFANKDNLESVYVPFRLIEAKDDATISSVIIGTNSQNPVKPEQLWALRPFMKDFEEYCSSLPQAMRIYIERREGQYRGNNSIPKSRVISLRSLMQSVAAVLLFVGGKANRAYSKVRNEYADKLFQEGHELSVYHFAAFTGVRYEFLWRGNKINKSYKIYKHIILTGIGMVLSSEKKQISVIGNKSKANAAAMSSYIENDEELENLIKSITNKIDSVMKSKTIPEGSELRDFIKTEKIQSEILNSFSSIKNPLSK